MKNFRILINFQCTSTILYNLSLKKLNTKYVGFLLPVNIKKSTKNESIIRGA